MRIIKNVISLSIAIVGFLGGLVWLIMSHYDLEPMILTIISGLEIIGYILLPDADGVEKKSESTKIKAEQNVNVNVNVGSTKNQPITIEEFDKVNVDRSTILDSMCSKTSILFIDDDKKFNVVKILKDSGWKKTKTVTDLKTLDVPVAKDADIIFVDINGVGRLLKLEYEGLDLALMLKQKYPKKKVIIYSANRNSNSFHEAWDLCDYKLEKNALPYQFQNLVEEYSVEIFNSSK